MRVKESPSRAEDPVFDSSLRRRDFTMLKEERDKERERGERERERERERECVGWLLNVPVTC